MKVAEIELKEVGFDKAAKITSMVIDSPYLETGEVAVTYYADRSYKVRIKEQAFNSRKVQRYIGYLSLAYKAQIRFVEDPN